MEKNKIKYKFVKLTYEEELKLRQDFIKLKKQIDKEKRIAIIKE